MRRLQEAAEWPDLAGTRYEVIDVLGRGGMGTVYRARDTQLGREVALKVLHGGGGQEEADRLLREAQVLARLEHPGLVPVHDAGRLADGRAYYVMRLVRGTCLDAHAREAGGGLPARLRLFLRVCEAVAFAHAHGIVHRDLKPQNVMVGPFGEVLVMDWGVARLRGETPPASAAPGEAPAGHTRAGTVMGTPGFMPPEQAAGRAAQADERADVYALGAMLRVLAAQPLPRPLASIVARATAAEPGQRYPGVPALASDVEAFLAAAPVSAHREGVLERLGRLLDRHRTPVLLVAGYLAMRIALIVFGGR